jgi:hypothetical protein
MSNHPTAGELIRALLHYYDGAHALNLAVNAYRRAHGSKNWVVAAEGLLDLIRAAEDEVRGRRFLDCCDVAEEMYAARE